MPWLCYKLPYHSDSLVCLKWRRKLQIRSRECEASRDNMKRGISAPLLHTWFNWDSDIDKITMIFCGMSLFIHALTSKRFNQNASEIIARTNNSHLTSWSYGGQIYSITQLVHILRMMFHWTRWFATRKLPNTMHWQGTIPGTRLLTEIIWYHDNDE